MCIICIEFNKHRDLEDADRMIEAARRESNAISEEHLKRVAKEIEKMKVTGQGDPLQIPD